MFEQAFKNIDDVLRKEAGCTTELDYSEQTSWLLFLKYLDGLEQDKAMEAGLEGRKFAFILDEPIVGKAGPHDPPEPPVSGPEPGPRPRKIKIMLADGKARAIQPMMMTSFWHPDGAPMSAKQFMELLFGALPEFFKDEAELRALWSAPDTRAKLLQGC